MWMPEEKLGPFTVVRCLSTESSLHPVYVVTHDERPGVREVLTFPYQPEGFRADVLAAEAAHWISLLSGAGLVPLRGLQILKGRLAALSPFYPDGSLEQRRAQRGSLPAGEVCRVVGQALVGLERLHAAGVVHECFHPRHLLCDGETVRLASVRFTPFLYPYGDSPGNLIVDRYVAPEEYDGRVPHVGSDLWAVGKTLEALLEDPLSASLRTLLDRCLAEDPSERYGSVQELRQALALAQAGGDQPQEEASSSPLPPVVLPSDLPSPFRKSRSRRPLRPVAAVLLTSVAALCFLGAGIAARGRQVAAAAAQLTEGVQLHRRGQHTKALVAFRKATTQAPQVADTWYWRGQCALALHYSQEAQTSLDKAIALKPNTAEYYSARGTAYESARKLTRALADYRTASRLEPKNPSFKKNLQRALEKQKRS